jgi:hypothetical protein
VGTVPLANSTPDPTARLAPLRIPKIQPSDMKGMGRPQWACHGDTIMPGCAFSRAIWVFFYRTYLEYLTLVRRVSASTQNQALNALQFLLTRSNSAVGTPPVLGARFDSRLAKLPPLVSEHSYNSRSHQ